MNTMDDIDIDVDIVGDSDSNHRWDSTSINYEEWGVGAEPPAKIPKLKTPNSPSTSMHPYDYTSKSLNDTHSNFFSSETLSEFGESHWMSPYAFEELPSLVEHVPDSKSATLEKLLQDEDNYYFPPAGSTHPQTLGHFGDHVHKTQTHNLTNVNISKTRASTSKSRRVSIQEPESEDDDDEEDSNTEDYANYSDDKKGRLLSPRGRAKLAQHLKKKGLGFNPASIWTEDEESRFRDALGKFKPGEINKIARHVGSRSVNQVRQHVHQFSQQETLLNMLHTNQQPPLTNHVPQEPSNHHSNGTNGPSIIVHDEHDHEPIIPKKPSVPPLPKKKKMSSCSSASLPSHKTLWTPEEQKLFEDGLESIGRGNWKEISKLIKTRNPLQVKNHARQYFKKLGEDKVAQIKVAAKKTKSKMATKRIHEDVNIVKKEEDSEDDGEIDIGDEEPIPAAPLVVIPSEEKVLKKPKIIPLGVDTPITIEHRVDSRGNKVEIVLTNTGHTTIEHNPDTVIALDNRDTADLDVEKVKIEKVVTPITSEKEEDQDSQSEDEFEGHFDPPTEEKILDLNEVTPEESDYNREFFCGNSVKTPQRYMKIRNAILDAWQQCRPHYLSKTSIRSSLKDCGDVNAMGRVHFYLESIGAINFGCDKPARFRARHHRSSHHHGHDDRIPDDALVHGRRRRRVRTKSGLWVYEDDLQRYTAEELEEYELAQRNQKALDARKGLKRRSIDFNDPFRMVKCSHFNSATNAAPFTIHINSNVLILMDVHSYLVKTEVIGLLGGKFDPMEKILHIDIAIPCNSISTGIQCEMDPISQVKAKETLQSLDKSLEVVGWYHSHPLFVPDPSIRDIETQSNFQKLFMKENGQELFVGIIVAPYDCQSVSDESQVNYITISKEVDIHADHRIPYQLPRKIIPAKYIPISLISQITNLVFKYCNSKSCVNMLQPFRPGEEKTHLQKLLNSISANLFLLPEEKTKFLNTVKHIILKGHKASTVALGTTNAAHSSQAEASHSNPQQTDGPAPLRTEEERRRMIEIILTEEEQHRMIETILQEELGQPISEESTENSKQPQKL